MDWLVGILTLFLVIGVITLIDVVAGYFGDRVSLEAQLDMAQKDVVELRDLVESYSARISELIQEADALPELYKQVQKEESEYESQILSFVNDMELLYHGIPIKIELLRELIELEDPKQNEERIRQYFTSIRTDIAINRRYATHRDEHNRTFMERYGRWLQKDNVL